MGARAARAAGLGEALVLSPSEEASGGRNKEAILGDVCESVVAALYLDSGFEQARAFAIIEVFAGQRFLRVRQPLMHRRLKGIVACACAALIGSPAATSSNAVLGPTWRTRLAMTIAATIPCLTSG